MRSISGVAAFMSRMAYMTPSGSPPQRRMRTTSTPTPIPKIHAPRGASGDVTGSVAMYTAPKSRPPEQSMNAGDG